MITYAAINLSHPRKKFQVGSTTDFDRRYSQHLKSNDNPEFHNSLREGSDQYYWIQSLDDGSDDRSEEQYYLDFYYGTVWCYNSNPNAEAPPSRKGKTWSEESKNNKSKQFRELDLVWVNDGKKAFRVPRSDSSAYNLGRGNTYHNGVREKVSLSHPGEGWMEGQLPSHKICPESRKRSGKDNPNSIPIYVKHKDWEAEVYYESIGLACLDNNLYKSCIRGVLSGKRKQHKGFTARFA